MKRECIKCGGSATKDYAYGCNHMEAVIPASEDLGRNHHRGEWRYRVRGWLADGSRLTTGEYPSHELAIEAWQRAWLASVEAQRVARAKLEAERAAERAKWLDVCYELKERAELTERLADEALGYNVVTTFAILFP